MTRDPNSYIAQSAEHLAGTLTKKNSDYAPTGEFSNFEKAAEVAGISVLQLITAQIAIKMTRIEKLMTGVQASNEPLKDSFLDLAGYSVIAHAYLEWWQGARQDAPVKTEVNFVTTADIKDSVITTVTEDRETIRNSFDEVVCSHTWVQTGDNVSGCTKCGEYRHG